jgi:hypothetical protein
LGIVGGGGAAAPEAAGLWRAGEVDEEGGGKEGRRGLIIEDCEIVIGRPDVWRQPGVEKQA